MRSQFHLYAANLPAPHAGRAPPSRLHIWIEPGTQLGGVHIVEIDLKGDPIQIERHRRSRLRAVQIIDQLFGHFRAMPADRACRF